MQEKVNKINDLNRNIAIAKEFLSLLERSNVKSKYQEEVDNFYSFEVASRICTGSDSVRLTRVIQDIDLMNKLSEVMKVVIRENIVENEDDLQNLIK